MSTNFASIEAFMSDIESRITGKITTSVADSVKKSVAVANVAEYLAKTFAGNSTTWAQLDAQSYAAIASSASGLMLAGNYDSAALGLVYLLYQAHVEVTNTAQAKLAAAAPAGTVVAGTPTSVAKEGLLDKIGAGVEGIAGGVVAGVEDVASKVEGVFEHKATAAPATTTAAPAAVAAPATVLSTPAPVVAAVNPPQAAPVAATPVLAS